jgi:hypothetical protein
MTEAQSLITEWCGNAAVYTKLKALLWNISPPSGARNKVFTLKPDDIAELFCSFIDKGLSSEMIARATKIFVEAGVPEDMIQRVLSPQAQSYSEALPPVVDSIADVTETAEAPQSADAGAKARRGRPKAASTPVSTVSDASDSAQMLLKFDTIEANLRTLQNGNAMRDVHITVQGRLLTAIGRAMGMDIPEYDAHVKAVIAGENPLN